MYGACHDGSCMWPGMMTACMNTIAACAVPKHVVHNATILSQDVYVMNLVHAIQTRIYSEFTNTQNSEITQHLQYQIARLYHVMSIETWSGP
jgi:hypothetical protein